MASAAGFHSLLSSGAEFNESEDHFAFRFRRLNTVKLTGLVFSGLFIVVDWLGMNDLGPQQLLATRVMAGPSLISCRRHP